MNLIRVPLSIFGAFFSAMFAIEFIAVAKNISPQHATGLAAVAGGLFEAPFSPIFWLLAIVFLSLFLATSKFAGKAPRILFFWIPTLGISVIGFAVLTLLTYFWLHFRHA
jgi:hypothetical protein